VEAATASNLERSLIPEIIKRPELEHKDSGDNHDRDTDRKDGGIPDHLFPRPL
jgi:hypothetical protein